jgi:MFS family permease
VAGGVFSSFANLLAHPGGRPQAVFGLVGRAPGSMLSVGFVAAAAAVGGDGGYAIGGAAAGAYALAFAFVGPSIGRLADRRGQRQVGRLLAAVSASAALLSVVTLLVHGATPLLVLLAGLAGGTQPNVGAFARVRWAALLERRPEAQTAQAFESIIDELTFVIGPPVVAILAGVWFTGLPIAVAALLLVIGAFGITSRYSLPVPALHPPVVGASQWRPEFPAGLGVLIATAFLGAALGAAQVLQLAYCDFLGMTEGAALVFFVNSTASLIGAVIVGGLTWKMPARRRLTLSLLVYAAGLLPSAFVAGYWPFVLASLLSGIAIAPTFIQANAVVAEETPARVRTAAFALIASAAGLGIALGAAVAGSTVSAMGGDEARILLVPLGVMAAVAAVVTDLGRRGNAQPPEDRPIDPYDMDAEAPLLPSPAPPPFVPGHHPPDPGDPDRERAPAPG